MWKLSDLELFTICDSMEWTASLGLYKLYICSTVNDAAQLSNIGNCKWSLWLLNDILSHSENYFSFKCSRHKNQETKTKIKLVGKHGKSSNDTAATH